MSKTDKKEGKKPVEIGNALLETIRKLKLKLIETKNAANTKLTALREIALKAEMAEKEKQELAKQQEEKLRKEKEAAIAKEKPIEKTVVEIKEESKAIEVEEPKTSIYIPDKEKVKEIKQDFLKKTSVKTETKPTYKTKKDNQSVAASSIEIAKNMPDKTTAHKKDRDKKKKSDKYDDVKKSFSKRDLIKRGYINDEPDFYGSYDESQERIVKVKKKKTKQENKEKSKVTSAVVNTEIIPIRTLAEKIGQPAVDIIKKIFNLGEIKTINDSIEFDMAELIASEFGVNLTLEMKKTAEDKVTELLNVESDEKNMSARCPIVTIMGHVDHGKTSLLDYIRKAHVASGEAGGITQHIGAYTIKVRNKNRITFLDTPGHEAFTTMRKRGAMVTDIAVIVVAGDDGVMPQTIEAISHAKAANVSVIVAVNKMDKPGVDIERIKNQLSQNNLLPEEWGGDTIVVPLSAKTGKGVDDLLDSILLVAEMLELKADKTIPAVGTIVEARTDKGAGPVATVIVSNGTLKIGDYIVSNTVQGKVKALKTDDNKNKKESIPGDAISILGFSELPNAGDQFFVVESEKLAKEIIAERIVKQKEDVLKSKKKKTLDELFKDAEADDVKVLPVVIKGDVQGSVEAVRQSLEKLSDKMKDKNVEIKVIHAASGAINESDVNLADTSDAIILAFNIRPDAIARNLAEKLDIEIRYYRVIYDLLEEIEKAMLGMLEPEIKEEVLGQATVREVFNISGLGSIAGSYVTEGKVVRKKHARLLRDSVVIYEGIVSSLRRLKDDVKEVNKGYECGIGLENYNDIKIGDVIEVFDKKKVKIEV